MLCRDAPEELTCSTSISKLLKAHLEETGYDDDLKDLAKGKSYFIRAGTHSDSNAETARTQDEPNLARLLDTITPKAKGQSAVFYCLAKE